MKTTTYDIESVVLQTIEVDNFQELENIEYIQVPEQDCYGTDIREIIFPATVTIWQTVNNWSVPFLNKPTATVDWTEYDDKGESYRRDFYLKCLLK